MIIRKPTPHISPRRRRLEDITLAVIHYTDAMSLMSTVHWFADPKSKVSAHYLIGRGGMVVQLADLDQVCWHAGLSVWEGREGCNGFSLGYELVGNAN